MKLHLPTGLRKALLACLAALAGRRALRRTVASGTALLGVFSLLWSTATPAQADEEPPLAAPSGDELALGTESEDEEEQDPLAANSEEDIMLLAAAGGQNIPPGWPSDGSMTTQALTLNMAVTGATEGDGSMVKLTVPGNTGEFNGGTLTVTGHVKALEFSQEAANSDGSPGAKFSAWNLSGATIDDIYSRGFQLQFTGDVNIGSAEHATNLHLGGRYGTGNSWEGCLRVNGHAVTLTGALVIEENTVLGVQANGTFTLNGELVTGGGSTTHNLKLGSHTGGTVQFLGGGDLDGQLVFFGTGSSSTGGITLKRLELGKGAAETETLELNVYGLTVQSGADNGIANSVITTGEDGLGTATLVLDGQETATYTYGGALGEANGRLNLRVKLGASTTQQLNGAVNLNDLTMESGTLQMQRAEGISVSGAITLTGGELVSQGVLTGGSDSTYAGAISVSSGGKLKIDQSEKDAGSVSGKSLITSLTIDGRESEVDFAGHLLVKSGNGITITGGASLTVGGQIASNPELTSQIGILALGRADDSNSAGTITVGGETRVNGLNVYGADSVASFENVLRVYGTMTMENGAVTVGSDMHINGVLTLKSGNLTIEGNYYGNGLSMTGGTMNVIGDYSTSSALTITGGQVTIGALLANGHSGFAGAVIVGGMDGSKGTLTVGASEDQSYANASNNVDAWVTSLTVQGQASQVDIEGSLALSTSGGTALSITGGSSVTIGYAIGGNNSFNNNATSAETRNWAASASTGDIVIGAAEGEGNTTGKLVVGGGIKARSITVQGAKHEADYGGNFSSLEVEGGIDLTGSLTITGTGNKAILGGSLTVVGGINVTNGGILQLKNATTVNGEQTWTIGAGSKLEMTATGASLQVASNGYLNLKIVTDISEGCGKLSLSGAAMGALATMGENVRLTLGDFSPTQSWECLLFDTSADGWTAETALSMLTALLGADYAGLEHNIVVDQSTGKVSYTIANPRNLTWSGSEGGGTWSNATNPDYQSNKPWKVGDDYVGFASYDHAFFIGEQGEGAITVDGYILVGSMNVSGGTAWSFRGSDATQDTLLLHGGLHLTQLGTQVSFGGNLAVTLGEITFANGEGGSGESKVTFDGTQAKLEGEIFSVSGAGTVEFTNSASLSFGSNVAYGLVIGNGTDKTIFRYTGSGALTLNSLEVQGGSEVTIANGGAFQLTSGMTLSGGARVTLGGGTDGFGSAVGGVVVIEGNGTVLTYAEGNYGFQQQAGTTVRSGATLIVANSGNKNFGPSSNGIQIDEDGVVELRNFGSLTNFWAHGNGTLKLAVGTALGGLGGTNFKLISDGNLAHLVLCDGTALVIGSSNDSNYTRAREYVVENGAALAFGADVMNPSGTTITVHIAGDGRQKRQGEIDHPSTTASYAALGLYNHSSWTSHGDRHAICSLNVVLDANASLGVGNNNADTGKIYVEMQGSIDFARHTLAKVGYGNLLLNGAFSASGESGVINVENGSITLAYTQNATALQNIDINLCGSIVGETAVSGALDVNESAAIGALYGSGSVTIADGKTLTLSNGSADQSFTGTLSGSGTLQVQGGALTLGTGFNVGNATPHIMVSDGGTLTLGYENGQTGGLLTMNGGALNVGTTATDVYTFAGLSGSGGAFSGNGKLVLNVGSGEQEFEGAIQSNYLLLLEKSGAGTQKVNGTGDSNLKELTVSGGVLEFAGNLTESNAAGTYGVTVNNGGTLKVGNDTASKNLLTNRSVQVTGTGSTLFVTGNLTLNNWTDFTVTGGGSATVQGALGGNKSGSSAALVGQGQTGQVTVGGHSETNSIGALTLGKEGEGTPQTQRVGGLTVAGAVEGQTSSLTVYGNVDVYGYSSQEVSSGNHTLEYGMQVIWGATGTISGALTVGKGFESGLALGGEGDGNTGTLTVGGLLTAHHLALAGNGSKLTANGGLTVTDAVNVTGGTLELGGTVSAGSLTVTNGTVKALSGMTATRGQTWTFGAGGVLEVGDDATLALSEGAAEWTLDIQVSESNAQGGQLKLTDDGLTALSELSGLRLTLTGLTEQGGNWTYQLFDVSDMSGGDKGSMLTQFVREVLQDYSARGLSVSNEGLLTYNSALAGVHDLTWGNGEGPWQSGGGGWNDSSLGGGDGVFENGDNVTFTSTDDDMHTVGIVGAVDPGNMQVTDGTWTFSGGDLSVTGSLTIGTNDSGANVTFSGTGALAFNSGVTVKRQSSMTLDKTGNVNLGNVTVEAAGEFVTANHDTFCNYTTDWGAVSGPGSIVLRDLGGSFSTTGAYTAGSRENDGTKGLYGMLSGSTGIGSIVLRGNSVMATCNSDAGSVFGKVTDSVVVEDGASLWLYRVDNPLGDREKDEHIRTLYLCGDGGENHAAALRSQSINHSIAWDVSLAKSTDGATIQTDSNLTLSGDLALGGKTLTKTGGSSLTLSGTVSGSGMIVVSGGTLNLAKGIDASGVAINLDNANAGINTTDGSGDRVTIAGITGTQAANIQGTWTIDTAGQTYEFSETVKRNVGGNEARWGVNLTKKGAGTQKFGAAESIYSLIVEEGTVEIGRWHIGEGAGWASTIVIGRVKTDGDGGTYKAATLVLSGTGGANKIKSADGALSLTVGKGGTLESKGDLSLENSGLSGTSVGAVSVHGGNLVVDGLFSVAGTAAITIDEGGSATLSGGLTAASVALSQGSLTLGGALNVANGVTASGGTLKLGTANVAESLAISLSGGAVFEMTEGTLTIGAGKTLTLTIDVASATEGGKLRLTDTVMNALLALKAQINFSITGAHIGANWEYKLFDVDELSGMWSKTVAESFLKGLLNPGEGASLTVDEQGTVRYALYAASRDLTWTGSDTSHVWDTSAANWQAGAQTGQTFGEHDSVTFDNTATAKNVTVSGALTPGDIHVTGNSTYTFTGQNSASIAGSGNLYVNANSSASFSGLSSFSIVGGEITGSLKLESTVTGTKSLGSMTVGSNGTITITDSTADNWAGTTLSGDGAVVLDKTGEVSVTDADNLFAALFAAGDGNVARSSDEQGIGHFRVLEGTTLKLGVVGDGAVWKDVGRGLSWIKRLEVEKGATLQFSKNVFDNADAGYSDVVGTLVLSGGETGNAAVLENTRQDGARQGVWVKWDIELGGDAIARNSGDDIFYFTGSAKLNANGHTLTLDGSGKTFQFGEGTATSHFGAAEGSTGAISLNSGVTLNFNTVSGDTFSGYAISLSEGSMLQVNQNATFHYLEDANVLGESVTAAQVTGGGTLTLNYDTETAHADGRSFSGTINMTGALIKRGTGTQKVTGAGDSQVKKLTVSGGVLEFAGRLAVAGTSTSDISTAGVTVSGGGTLSIGEKGAKDLSMNYYSLEVTGAGSSLSVIGNLQMNSWGNLTVKDGGEVTVKGRLYGNKRANSGNQYTYGVGQVTVGGHSEGEGSIGSLTLGTEGGSQTSYANGLTVMGSDGGQVSKLTVNGNLMVYGGSRTEVSSGNYTLEYGMQVGWGATGDISGTLTVGDSACLSGLALGGEGDGNTGTLAVEGLLTAHHLALAGNGSKLTANGGLTVTDAVNVTGGTLELGGAVSSGSLTVANGTVKALSGMTATRGQIWTFGAGGVLEVGDDTTLALSEGAAEWTLDIRVSGSPDNWQGGQLRLTDDGLTALSELSGLRLTLTGLEDQEDGWTYWLFDVTDMTEEGKGKLTEFVKQVLQDYSARGLSVNDQGVLTYNSALAGVHDLTWGNGEGTWQSGGEGWNDSSLGGGVGVGVFENGDNVTFTSTDDDTHTVEIVGAVDPGNMQVTDGTWIFSGGNLIVTRSLTIGTDDSGANVTFSGEGDVVWQEGTTLTIGGNNGEATELHLAKSGSLTGGDAVIKGGATLFLEMGGDTSRNLAGTFTVEEDGTFVVKGYENYVHLPSSSSNTFKVQGEGTLKLVDIGGNQNANDNNNTTAATTYGNSNGSQELYALLQNGTGISSLVLSGDTFIKTGSGSDATNVAAKIKDSIVIEDGASLLLTNWNGTMLSANATKDDGTKKTLYLSGSGDSGVAEKETKTHEYALGYGYGGGTEGSNTVAWDVSLEKSTSGATIDVNSGKTLTISGALNLAGQTLTKAGSGTLTLTGAVGLGNPGANSGVIVQAGTLTISGALNLAGQTLTKAGSGTLQLTGTVELGNLGANPGVIVRAGTLQIQGGTVIKGLVIKLESGDGGLNTDTSNNPVTIAGITGTQAANMQGTWTIDTAGKSYEFSGTVKRDATRDNDKRWGVNLTKKGEGAQKFGAAESIYGLTVEEGTLEIGRWYKDDGNQGQAGWANSIVIGGIAADEEGAYKVAKLLLSGSLENKIKNAYDALSLRVNEGGTLESKGDLSLEGSVGTVSVHGGELSVEGEFSVNGGAAITVNEGGKIQVEQLTAGGATVTLSGSAEDKQGKLVLAEGESQVSGLLVGAHGVLELQEGVTLTASTLAGVEGQYGSITGPGTLKLTAASGSYGGSVGSNFTYDAAGGEYTLGGFSGSVLTVAQGHLILESVLSGGSNVTLGDGVELSLANGDNAVEELAVTDSGTLHMAGGTLTTTLSGGGTLHVTGDFLAEDGTATLSVSGDTGTNVVVDLGDNITISSTGETTLKSVTGSGSISGNLTLSGTEADAAKAFVGTVDSGSQVTVSGGSWTLGGGAQLAGAVTVNSGASLALVKGDTVELQHTLTLNGGLTAVGGDANAKATLSISMASSDEVAAIQLGGTVNSNLFEGITLTLTEEASGLSGFTDDNFNAWSYHLFDLPTSWVDDYSLTDFKADVVGALDASLLSGHSDWKFVLDDQGYLRIELAGTLVWNVGGANDTWSTTDANWGTGDHVPWEDDEAALFDDAEGEAITLSGELRASGVTVKRGTRWSFTAQDGGSLEVAGDLTVADGAALTVGAGTPITVGGNIALAGSLTLASDITFGGSITGSGSIARDASASDRTVYVLWSPGADSTWTDFTGKYGADALGTGVGYGVQLSGGNLTISGAATFNHDWKVSGSGTLTFGQGVSVASGTSHSIIVEDASMVVTGNLEAGGVSSSITVDGGSLTVTGNLQQANGASTGSLTVLNGGRVTLGTETGSSHYAYVTGITVGAEGDSAASTVTIHGDVANGTGTVVVSDGGVLEIDGRLANSSQYNAATGAITVGNTTSSGTMSVGGAVLTSGVTIQGEGSRLTLKNAETAQASSLGALTVGAGATFRIGSNHTATVTSLAGVSEGYGSITGDGTLILTAASGRFDGAVSSVLTYQAEGGTYTLGTYNGSALTVGSGTLQISTQLATTGTVMLNGGELELTDRETAGAADSIGALTSGSDASSVTIGNNRALTVNTLSGSLESLTMGNQARLTVQSGNLSISGAWNWGEGSTLALRGENAQITLGGGIQLPGGGNKLTIDLSEALLGGNGGRSAGEYQLFTGDGLSRLPEDWADNFAFTVGEREVGESYYNGLALDGTGLLTWDDAVGSNNMYWGANASDAEVVLGSSEEGEWSAEQGVAGTEAWANNKNIFLQRNEAGNVSVTVVNGARMRTLNISGSATYVMEAGGEGSVTVTVNSTFTNHATVSVKENVTVNAEGGYTGTGTLKLAGGNVSVRTVSAVNRADVTAGTLTLAAGSTITELTGTPGEGQGALVTSEGALTVGQGSYGGALSVAGDLTVTGNFTYGGQNGKAGALNVGGALNLAGSLTVTDLKGSGAIAGSGTLSITGGNESDFGALSVGRLDLTGGGTLKLGQGATLGSLHMEKGSKLALGSSPLKANFVEVGATGGGLSISMTGEAGNLDFGSISFLPGEEGGHGQLTITLNGYDAWAKEHEGETYQLFKAESFASLWDALKGDQTEEDWWEDYFKFDLRSSNGRNQVTGLSRDGRLTFMAEEGTVWTGSKEGGEDANVWSTPTDPESSDPDGNWGEGNKAPGSDAKVTFSNEHTESEAGQQDEVKLSGEVKADEVYVDSGDFKFTGKEGSGKTDSLSANKLTIGGQQNEEGNYKDAHLDLDADLKDKIDESGTTTGTIVDLQQGGSLDVQKGASFDENTSVQFNGGEVKFTGESHERDIVSSKVDVENSSDKVKVNVAEDLEKSWEDHDGELSGGVALALDKGIEKSGEGDFTLRWQDEGSSTPHSGDITVTEGTLTLKAQDESGAKTAAAMGGKVTGKGTLKAGEGSVELSGNVSEFEGTLHTGGSNTGESAGDEAGGGITLTGEAASGTVQADVSGNSTLDVKSTSGVTLTGDLGTAEGDNLTVKNSGAGDLVIAGSVGNGTTLDTVDESKGAIVLGDGSQDGNVNMSSYSGTVAGSGDLVLANVELSDGFNKGSANLYVDTALAAAGESDQPASYARRRARRAARGAENDYAGGIVDMGGMDVTNKLSGISVNADGLLKGVTGSYTTDSDHNLTLHFTSSNWGEDAGSAKNALIQGSGAGFTLDTSSNENVNFEFDVDIFKAFATGDPNKTKEIWLHLADNTNWEWSEEQQGEQAKDWWNHFLFGTVKGVTYEEGGDGGVYVRLSGTAEDLYIVMGGDGGDGATSDRADQLSGKKATVLLDGQTLTLNWAGNGGVADPKNTVVHNLLGAEGTALSITDTSGTGNRLNVSLDNTLAEDIYDSRRPESDLPKPEGSTVHGQHTTFLGSITGEAGVDITKVGKGTLTVGGDYRLTDGTTTITEGALKLRGADNRMKGLVFAYGTEDPDKNNGEDARGLLLEGGKTTVTGSIKEGGEEGVKKGDINLSKGAELELNGQSELEGTSFTGDGTGTITLKTGVGEGDEEGASLTLRDAASISGVGVNLAGKDTVLDVGETTGSTLSALNGTGTVTIGSGGALTVESGTFSGTLGVAGTENATFAVAAGKSFTFDNITTTASGEDTGKVDIQLGDNATLRMDLTKTGSGDDETIQFGDIDVGNGRMILDTGAQNTANVAGELRFGEQGMLVLKSSSAQGGDFTTKLTSHSMTPEALRGHVQLSGVGFLLSEVSSIGTDEEGYLTVQTREATQNKFERALPGSTKNPLAGAQMVWDSLKSIQQWEAFINALCHPNSDYDRIILDLTNKLDSGQTGELERSLAAIAGSSLSTLGPAFSEDLHRQLKTIRNRTTSMDASAAEVQGEEPMHMWISGEGGYHKLEADGYFSGYTLNSWGGSLGMNVDVSKKTTLGLAITAMYGDLKTESADVGRGNLDTMYLSGFMRTASGAWLHTLAITGGVADVQMNRTVNYGSGSYATQGSTSGYALGALYEVGYTKLMNAEGTVALQPVANVEFRHVGIKGYTETGSDAALRVDDIEQNILTFGVGARLQSIVGERTFNRSSIFEARLLLKTEVGDRSGTARNGFVGTKKVAEVESAEVGAVGIEAGAGLTIPLGNGRGSIFMDASIEYRRGWTSVNASAGYKIDF